VVNSPGTRVVAVIFPAAHGTPMTATSASSSPGRAVATLGGGCFWCTEAVLSELRGVDRVEPGYAGGHLAHPTYEDVCSGTTGHAEVVQVTFDPAALSFHDLLSVFFSTHDPTTRNRQGADVGPQYRSIVLYHDADQRSVTESTIQELNDRHLWKGPIVTEVVPFARFWPAEEYHRDYFRRNPGQGYCRAVIEPKVAKFRAQFVNRLKK
jgi:peptide-methionine (S)-S-oxide reductase